MPIRALPAVASPRRSAQAPPLEQRSSPERPSAPIRLDGAPCGLCWNSLSFRLICLWQQRTASLRDDFAKPRPGACEEDGADQALGRDQAILRGLECI